MLSKQNQNTGQDRQALLILASAAGGILLLILLLVLALNLAEPGDLERLTRVSRGMGGTFTQSFLATLEEQARIMGLPLETGSNAFWYLARAGGIVAYMLLWLATCWGIMMSSKVIKGAINIPVAFALHEYLPIMGVVFAAVHALALLGDTYIGFTVWQLLVPFASTYEPFWTGLGSLAFYLFLALIASFYLRKQLGQKSWRAFHYTSYFAFLIALLHGLMAGSDSGALAMRALYLVTGGISLFLLYYRMLAHAPRKNGSPSARAPQKE